MLQKEKISLKKLLNDFEFEKHYCKNYLKVGIFFELLPKSKKILF